MNTEELTIDEVIEQLTAEFQTKLDAAKAMKLRHQAELAEQAQALDAEQQALEREVAKRKAQSDLAAYVNEWRAKFLAQADAAGQAIQQLAVALRMLREAGQTQDMIRQRAQDGLTEFAQGLQAYSPAFDSEQEMRQAAYNMGEQLTASINWNIPASTTLRLEFGMHNNGWRDVFGDGRRQAIDKGLKAQPAPAPTDQAALSPVVDLADELDQLVLADADQPTETTPALALATPQRRNKRK